eukprot:TRINITY_DN23439_c0_g1_i2.p1 TRINITY_DN23439_c0_g1~~TRINITY_DN23439_c0_g1_i2.p1  ORF type:complete len:523 (+),score=184.38 TRINITY_DN23439_c0_g1_i2:60-1571(+)
MGGLRRCSAPAAAAFLRLTAAAPAPRRRCCASAAEAHAAAGAACVGSGDADGAAAHFAAAAELQPADGDLRLLVAVAPARARGPADLAAAAEAVALRWQNNGRAEGVLKVFRLLHEAAAAQGRGAAEGGLPEADSPGRRAAAEAARALQGGEGERRGAAEPQLQREVAEAAASAAAAPQAEAPRERLGLLHMRLGSYREARRAFLDAFACNGPRSAECAALALAAAKAAAAREELLPQLAGRGALSPELRGALAELRRALRAAGWGGAAALRASGLERLSGFAGLEAAAAGDAVDARLGAAGPVGELTRLWLLHRPLPLARALALLGEGVVWRLVELRLLAVADRSLGVASEGWRGLRLLANCGSERQELAADGSGAICWSNVQLWAVPVPLPPGQGEERDLYVATDWQSTPGGGGVEIVPCCSEADIEFAQAACRAARVQRALVPHCGGGLRGLAALATYADEVDLADRNERAVRLARLGLHLNLFAERGRAQRTDSGAVQS